MTAFIHAIALALISGAVGWLVGFRCGSRFQIAELLRQRRPISNGFPVQAIRRSWRK